MNDQDPAGAAEPRAVADPAGDGPAQVTPAGDGPAQVTPAGDGPAQVTLAGDRPAQVTPAGDGPRQVTEVETLKALADPVRLAILTTLMGSRADLPVMSVKELAAELSEPQTKLYRHVRQLEAAGLIHVAASRLVSGILEQRYQASQRDLVFGPGLLRDSGPDESEPVVAALLDRYRDGFFTAHRAGLLGSPRDPSDGPDRKGIMAITEIRVPARKAASVAIRLQQIMDELNTADDPATDDPDTDDPATDDPDTVMIHVMIGCYSTPDDA